MDKPTSTQPPMGDPVRAAKSDPKPAATIDQPAPDIDFNHPKMLLKIEFLKRSKLCREGYESLKSGDFEAKLSEEDKKKLKRLLFFHGINRERTHILEFERWLEYQIKESEEWKNRFMSFDVVSDMGRAIIGYLKLARDYFSAKEERDPSADELIDHFEKFISRYYGRDNVFLLDIRSKHGTKEEYDAILKGVAKILESKMPKKRFMEYELNRYLRVYDSRVKGMKWKDIYFKIYPQHKGEEFTDNARRALYMDKEKAEKVIKKLEEDEFFWWS